MIDTDVLVVGSEGAGARAAIEASKFDLKVTVVTKGQMAKCGATMTAAASITLDGRSVRELGFTGDPKDSKEKLFEDIVRIGGYLSDQKVAWTYARDGPMRVKELLDWGMKARSSWRRGILTTGMEIVRVLEKQVRGQDIEVIEDTMITDLLTKGNRVVGAVGLDLRTGEFVIVRAKAIVLATGGWPKAYSFTNHPEGLTGDGQAMAYRAGAELVDTEFVLFSPNVMLSPPIWRENNFLFNVCSVRGYGHLLNKLGDRFMGRYDPEAMERDAAERHHNILVSIGTMTEVIEGRGSPHGGVYLSFKHFPDNLLKEIENDPRMKDYAPDWNCQGVDFKELWKMLKKGEAIEVGTSCHFFQGGVKINEYGETNLLGLYAAGECSGGLWGAFRHHEAMTQILVQGAIAGESAAKFAMKISLQDSDVNQTEMLHDRVLAPLKRKDGIKPVELMKRFQKTAYEKVGVIRSGEGLNEALKEFEEIRRLDVPRLRTSINARRYNMEWIEAIQCENMLQMLEISTRAAMMRIESRGTHYRTDFANTDNDTWLKNIVVKEVAGKMLITTQPPAVTTVPLPRGTQPYCIATQITQEKQKAAQLRWS